MVLHCSLTFFCFVYVCFALLLLCVVALLFVCLLFFFYFCLFSSCHTLPLFFPFIPPHPLSSFFLLSFCFCRCEFCSQSLLCLFLCIFLLSSSFFYFFQFAPVHLFVCLILRPPLRVMDVFFQLLRLVADV